MLQHGVAFWYQEDDEGDGLKSCTWLCERCEDFDPEHPGVKSDKEGYTQWMSEERKKPSREPETHMQTWPEFCKWGRRGGVEKTRLITKLSCCMNASDLHTTLTSTSPWVRVSASHSTPRDVALVERDARARRAYLGVNDRVVEFATRRRSRARGAPRFHIII